jgi:hypothetical protein
MDDPKKKNKTKNKKTLGSLEVFSNTYLGSPRLPLI